MPINRPRIHFRPLSALLSLVLLFTILSCKQKTPMHWTTTDEGYAIWCPIDSAATYSWNGSTFENLINGEGTLTINRGTDSTQTLNITAYYGAQSQDNATRASEKEYYIGEVSEGKYTGFAVLLKTVTQNQTPDIYLGTFAQGKPSGTLNLYRSGKLYYSGQWKDGTFNGQGTLYKEDGSIKTGLWENGTLISAEVNIETPAGKYEGTILNGLPNGYGQLSYNNSSIYQGNWQNGTWNGLGQYIIRTDTITSEWANGKANGATTLISGNYQYHGQFANDLPHGNGSYFCLTPNQQYIYAGEWSKGKRHGYGDAVYHNGDTYYGEWKDDTYNGVGRYRYANGDTYDGQWENNMPNGSGQYTSPAFKYGGQWLEGWIHGYGRIDFANGDIYEGEFCQGQKCGQGIYQFANGNTYEGEFYNDQINGLGIFTFADGNRYEGEFLNGKISGNGTLYFTDSTGTVTLTAFWDKPNQFPSSASIIFPNGDCYEGPLVNGEPTAEGIWHIIDPTSGKAKLLTSLTDINQYYKQHRETINTIVTFTSITLTAIEIAATIAIPFTGGASAPIALAAGYANIALNAADITLATTSAAIDLANAETAEEQTAAAITLGTEVAVNAAFILVPKALQAGPVKAITSKLSTAATSSIRTSIIKFTKNNALGKVVKVIKDKEKKIILSLEKSTIGSKYLRATSKIEYQYVTNKQVQKMLKDNPNLNAPTFNPNAIGHGATLGANTRQFMSKKALRRYNAERRIMGSRRAQWHHAIAGNKDNAAAEKCREILRKFKIDINDGRNGILLPVEPKSIMRGTIHGKHVNNYDEHVFNRLRQAKTQEQCLEIMDEIKKELYLGHLQLLVEHKVNTLFRTVVKESMY